ncbi:ASCH domain-containing protein [Chitinibacter sp. FCG-7]|uniref:ASCH domain-containing protein n=1 Tax=Chitinibacter mangrovi TaxID=3153927 RepID=A0AAU7FE66_9NEIS
MQSSISELWNHYRSLDAAAPAALPLSYCFSDNAEEADALLELILSGRKCATAPSVAELQIAGDPIPKPGDFAIVTDWNGMARAIIRTRAVEIRRFGDVDEDFARIEGEGDQTLGWWREAHRSYYTRVLAGTDHAVDDDLEIVCEQFDLVYPGSAA